jgi:environmental stress-induced protein Ves
MAWHLVRWTDAAEVPWKNGGGVTRELVVHGGDPFEWRLSAATIDRDGPFSEFAGVDRVLVLVRGRGVSLDIGGVSVRLESPGAGVAFAGEARVGSRLIDGPTVDLNLMTRRDLLEASWSVVAPAELLATGDADVVVAHVLSGDVAVDGVAVEAGDTAWWESASGAPAVSGTGSLVRFGLTRRR